jgi:signal transduction histidine kinase/AmiR/NasT family two-component response regulator
MGERTNRLGLPKGAASSFQSRIAGMALLTAVSVLLAASAVFILQQWMSERVMLRRHQALVARVISQQAAQLADNNDPRWADDALAPLAKTPNIGGAYLFAPDGKLLSAYGQDRGGPAGASASDQHYLEVRAPITRGGKPAGEVVILSEGSSLGAIVARYFSAASALFFAATALALFLAKWLAGRVIEPVRRLSGAMNKVAESGDFTQEVEPVAEDELGRLTDTFNGLLRKLNVKDQALHRTMDELVEARDAAEAANVLKSQFLANMSHEIRTPLNGVLAMAQIMDMGDLSDVQRERLSVVSQSGEALLAILNDVLDLSKIEAGKMELELAEFELADIVQHAQAAYGETAARRGLSLVVDLHESAGGRRKGDAGRLRQIASNLLSNALKFTERGEVRLTLMGEVEDGQDMLHMVVSDSGIGIPAAKVPLLFQKFTQVDSSTTRRFGGTGLGLAICRELAGLMGGRIWVESQEGDGSAFHLVAPLARVEAMKPLKRPAPAQISAPAPGGAKPLRVLAAEDNATNQLVLRTIMQTFGVDLTMVADGKQAVDAWSEGDFDLILMDIQMPVMDGVAATRLIRETEAQSQGRDGARRRTPIIALSANAMTHQVKEYLGVGMDLHVAKPIELSKLHAALRTVSADQDSRISQSPPGAASGAAA